MTITRSRSYPELLPFLWPVPAVLLVSIVVLWLPSGSTLRLLSALVALSFLPGYALTLAVFPGRQPGWSDTPTPMASEHRESTLSSLGPIERIAMGVGFSVCLMPLYGYVVALGIGGYDPGTAVVLVSVTTVLSTLLALGRVALSPSTLTAPSPFSRLATDVVDRSSAPTRNERVLNLAVVAGLLLAAAYLSVSIAMPPESPEYTTATLLTENDDGELVADGYPDRLGEGESAELVFRLENHENREVEYQVIVQHQRVAPDGSVIEETRLDRFERTVLPGQPWDERHSVTSAMSGDRNRLVYLVYVGDAPTEPTVDNAYRSLTLWLGSGDPPEETNALSPSSNVPAPEQRVDTEPELTDGRAG
ncbi:hypothetical protein DQW50_07755 [Halorubrum sp. 48-1-W]|uniref:DUF1616 domain-containing protein n=1 Tax=Halorubrum sp. 48-1-W TaxID=2249761 RepID=UPI000DCEFA02|nr:DUF1616 domain-containing protein [Halorubrum sp. 48-1-W]RAW45639.1 hypothetical protein DQW50_07755 [Halorubrum sp. 48-1-W]